MGGTPSYIAPEQLLGHWHQQGPWTDLYAVGAMTWYLTCGRPPYSGTRDEKFEAHLAGQLPEYAPRIEVPDGLEDWLCWLLRRETRDRPAFAVEARRALARLGSPILELPPLPRAETGLGLTLLRRPPLVGRSGERGRLLDVLDEVRKGAPRVVVLRGPSGIGKASLGR
ncbi:MAG: hypothetical protein GY913_35835 [Proteobacteria bacterium]|nr:hypothetical protein [Pseudomonadota bacterium]MCP4922303.1 hypothetical protein [Pseudomonadota bacterium]